MFIISGDLKGHKVTTSRKQEMNKELRPTTNYSRQVLFNILANNKNAKFDFCGSKVLDCFAGTGTVGFEFLSRGASEVVFLENDPENLKQLNKNISRLKVNARALNIACPKIEKMKGEKFDFMFIDPPYYKQNKGVAKTILKLFKDYLNESGVLVFEFATYPKELNLFLDDLFKRGANSSVTLPSSRLNIRLEGEEMENAEVENSGVENEDEIEVEGEDREMEDLQENLENETSDEVFESEDEIEVSAEVSDDESSDESSGGEGAILGNNCRKFIYRVSNKTSFVFLKKI